MASVGVATNVKMTMAKVIQVIAVMKAVRSLFMHLKNKELKLTFPLSERSLIVDLTLAREAFALKKLIIATRIVNMVPLHS